MGGTLLVYGKMTDHHHIFIFFLTQLVSWTVFSEFQKPNVSWKLEKKLFQMVSSRFFCVNSLRNDDFLNIFREIANNHHLSFQRWVILGPTWNSILLPIIFRQSMGSIGAVWGASSNDPYAYFLPTNFNTVCCLPFSNNKAVSDKFYALLVGLMCLALPYHSIQNNIMHQIIIGHVH